MVNIQAGANHLGPDHFQLMLEQVGQRSVPLNAAVSAPPPSPLTRCGCARTTFLIFSPCRRPSS